MITCSVCHAWRPKQWDGSKWIDDVAACVYKGGPFEPTHTCEHASIVNKFNGKDAIQERFDAAREAAVKAVGKDRPLWKDGMSADQAAKKYWEETDVVTQCASSEDVQSIEQSTSTERTEVRADPKPSNKKVVPHCPNDDFSDASTPQLYEHQQEAVEYFDSRTEIALFFEMGVGKTATILAIVANKFKRKEIDALLVVAPNDVHKQWAAEQIPLWLGVPYDIQCLYGRGGSRQAYPFTDDPDMLQVVCVNIDTFSTPQKWKDIVEWANGRRTFIVLDEATSIKNVNAQRTQRMLYEFNKTLRKGKSIIASQSNSVARAILTGTPVTNGAMDLWAMMEFLRPNYFNRNWYSFQNYFGMFTKMAVNDREIQVPLTAEWWEGIKRCTSYGEAHAICGCSEDTFNVIHSQDSYQGPYKHADELRALIAPVSKFKLLTDCVDMPPQTYITRTLTMDGEQKRCYDSMVDEFIAEYDDYTMTALNKLSVMIRLQQISSGFLYDKTIVEDFIEEDGSLESINACGEERDITPDDPIKWIGTTNPKLEMMYRDVEECSKPCIILTRFTAEASRIFNDLNGKYRCSLITGWKRVGTIEDFKAGKYDIMVANSSVIARGFNLQNSHTMLIYSNTFSLETRLQAEGRIFRLGQTNPCQYIDYTFVDSIDEKIVSALLLKRNLLDYIRNANAKELVA